MEIRIPQKGLRLVESVASRIQGRHPFSTQLQPGQIVKAQVTGLNTDNRFLLQIGEHSVTASSDLPLRAGQPLMLQVMSTSPQIELKVIADNPSQQLARLLAGSGGGTQLGSQLQSLLSSPLIMKGLSPQYRQTLETILGLQQSVAAHIGNGPALKQLIDSLGLTITQQTANEHGSQAVSTLKAALLELLHNAKGLEQVAGNANRLLASLELFQFAQLQTDSNSLSVFPLLLPFLEQGYLHIEHQSDQNNSNDNNTSRQHRFSLHLKMAELGNLRIEFSYAADGGLFIRFHTESAEIAKFVCQFDTELRNSISDVALAGLSFTDGAGDPMAELLSSIVSTEHSVLDTTI